MAEETKNVVHEHDVPKVTTEEAEVTDRGLFDFLGKKKEETKPEETIDSEFKHEEEEKKPSFLEKLYRSDSSSSSSSEEEGEDGDWKKKHSLLEKLYRSDSSSSSSSEEEGEDGEKKKDKKKTAPTTTAEGEVKSDELKKGFMDKLKELLPGHGKKPEDASPVEEAHLAEKKGIVKEMKEKIKILGEILKILGEILEIMEKILGLVGILFVICQKYFT